MTRDQALTIINNIDVIEAFAKGKTIAFDIHGKLFITNTMVLSNFKSDRPTGYVVLEDPYEHQH